MKPLINVNGIVKVNFI